MYIHVIEHHVLSTRDQGFQKLWQKALASCWLWISVTSWAPWKWKSLSRVRLFVTPPTIPSMEVSKVEHWSIVRNTVPFCRGFSQPRDRTQVSHIARRTLYQLSHQGSPRILEWVAYPFSKGSSWPRNRTGVSCIAGRFWAPYLMNSVPLPFLPVDWWWQQPTEQKIWSNNRLWALLFLFLPFYLFLLSLLIAHLCHYQWEAVEKHYSSSKKERAMHVKMHCYPSRNILI